MKASISRHDSRSTKATARSIFNLVMGSLLLSAGIIALVAQRLLSYFFDFPGQTLGVLVVILFAFAFLLGEKGIRGIGLAKTFRKLDDALASGPVTLGKLLTRTGLEEKLVLSEISRMISHGGFWVSVATLEDCIVLERDPATRPLMIMADEGMSFSEKRRRGRVSAGFLVGLCLGMALYADVVGNALPLAITVLGSLLAYNFSFILYPKNIPVISCRELTRQTPEEIASESLSGNDRADSLISQGQEHLRELATLGTLITDPHIRMRIEQISSSTRQLLGLLKSHPEKHGHARQSIEYCLPTAIKLLHQYDELSSQPVKGENIRESLDKITEMSDMVAEILNRELDSLYEDRAINIEVDIEVMRSLMRQPLDISGYTEEASEPKAQKLN